MPVGTPGRCTREERSWWPASTEITLHQQRDGGVTTVTLRAGDAAVNPAGVWHTADVASSARVLFITAGAGTEHRAR